MPVRGRQARCRRHGAVPDLPGVLHGRHRRISPVQAGPTAHQPRRRLFQRPLRRGPLRRVRDHRIGPPLLLAVVLVHVEILQQLLPVARLDGFYLLGDIVGVPDLFGRVRPVLASLVPGTRRRAAWDCGRLSAPGDGWVLVVVPLLIGLFVACAVAHARARRIPRAPSSCSGRSWSLPGCARHPGSRPRPAPLVLIPLPLLGLVLIVVDILQRFSRVTRPRPGHHAAQATGRGTGSRTRRAHPAGRRVHRRGRCCAADRTSTPCTAGDGRRRLSPADGCGPGRPRPSSTTKLCSPPSARRLPSADGNCPLPAREVPARRRPR